LSTGAVMEVRMLNLAIRLVQFDFLYPGARHEIARTSGRVRN